jgi:hypothetical protein
LVTVKWFPVSSRPRALFWRSKLLFLLCCDGLRCAFIVVDIAFVLVIPRAPQPARRRRYYYSHSWQLSSCPRSIMKARHFLYIIVVGKLRLLLGSHARSKSAAYCKFMVGSERASMNTAYLSLGTFKTRNKSPTFTQPRRASRPCAEPIMAPVPIEPANSPDHAAALLHQVGNARLARVVHVDFYSSLPAPPTLANAKDKYLVAVLPHP